MLGREEDYYDLYFMFKVILAVKSTRHKKQETEYLEIRKDNKMIMLLKFASPAVGSIGIYMMKYRKYPLSKQYIFFVFHH